MTKIAMLLPEPLVQDLRIGVASTPDPLPETAIMVESAQAHWVALEADAFDARLWEIAAAIRRWVFMNGLYQRSTITVRASDVSTCRELPPNVSAGEIAEMIKSASKGTDAA